MPILLTAILTFLFLSPNLLAEEPCQDYFTSEWANPLDMNDREDVLYNLVPREVHNLTPFSYQNGIFKTKVKGHDPYFRLLSWIDNINGVPVAIPDDSTRFGHNKPIRFSDGYRYLSFRMYSSKASAALVLWEKKFNGWGITDIIQTSSGWHTYVIDLATKPLSNGSGDSAWTSGEIAGLRINPAFSGDPSGADIKDTEIEIDWIQLTKSNHPDCVGGLPDRPVVKFLQPDKEGGEDYFTKVRGNPSDMSSLSDIDLADNLSEAWLYPGNSYVDSGGNIKYGDYFEGRSITGNDDPINFSVFIDNARPIDPDKYKIACFSLDVLMPVESYHSVARVLWQRDSKNVNGDDLVLKTSGESRYCLRMDTMQTEGEIYDVHPWRKNSDGTGINFWRVDAHEESLATSFRFQDIRLAEDHKADTKFTIVLEGNRDRDVTLYYSKNADGSAATSIGTIAAGRNTDVFIWNTTGIAEDTYYLYLTVGNERYFAPGRIIISHNSAVDNSSPILSVDAPLNNPKHKFKNSLEIAGHVVDDLRVATLEAFLDNQLIATFRPSDFRLSVRKAYPTLPYSGDSGFQLNVTIPDSVSEGDHNFTLKAYDTAGNITEYSTVVQKVGGSESATAAIVYAIPNEARVAVPTVSPQPPPTASPAPTNPPPVSESPLQISAKISSVKSKKAAVSTVNLKVDNASGCSSVEVLANIAPNTSQNLLVGKKPKVIYSGPALSGALNFTGLNVKSLKSQARKTDTNLYVVARCDGGRYSKIIKINASKVNKSKSATVPSMKSFLSHFKSKMKLQ